MNLLLKGRSFIPNQPPNPFQIKCATEEFRRTVRLAINHENTQSSTPRFYVRSQNIPPPLESDNDDNINVERFLTELNDKAEEPLDRTNTTYRSYRKTRQSLKFLLTDENFVIQCADKGQSFVILNKKDYSDKVRGMLNAPDYYKHHNGHYHCQDIVDKVIKLFQCIPVPKIKRFIQEYDVQTPVFYALPKIHKSKVVAQALINQQLQTH